MSTTPKQNDPAETAAQAQRQKQDARAPQSPTQPDAAKRKPPETGKPLYDKPHSS